VRIVRTDRAEEDLIDIWTYIALDNERAADGVLDVLE
jgi:toxin ParE1/3/4